MILITKSGKYLFTILFFKRHLLAFTRYSFTEKHIDMKIYYHLPNYLIYDSNKKKFKNITFNLAAKYLKLIYKDSETFQSQFLLKLEQIKDLNAISKALKLAFDQTEPFTSFDLERIADKNILKEANSYFEKEDVTLDKKSSFFQTYVAKINAFLDQETQVNNTEIIFDEFLNYKKIDTIEEYVLTEKEDRILFEIKNVGTLRIESSVTSFVCEKMNLKSIQLNKELLFLNLNGNAITEIILNESLINLEIAGNNLKELQCNTSLKELFITNNQLEKLKLNAGLEELVCNGNNLKSIELNTNLKSAYLMYTPLSYIKLNKNLLELNICHPKNENIEIDNSIENTQVKVNYDIN